MNIIAKKIQYRLQNARGVLIAIHKNPDGDAAGSGLAMVNYLQSINVPAKVFCGTGVPQSLSFLPGVEQITSELDYEKENFDTLICLDSGDPTYAQVQEIIEKYSPFIINIDHHQTNSGFGDLNLLDFEAASTTSIIYWFFKWNNIRINKSGATALLTGLITDTDNFTNSATTTTALMIASELVRLGANLNSINFKTVKNKTVDTLKLWGRALSRLSKHAEIDLAHTYLTQQDFVDCNVNEETSEGISNFLNNLDGAKIALILKETKDGKIKGSLRTTAEDVDVAKIAQALGGGGHKKAAGFTADGTTEQILEKIAQIYKANLQA